MMIRTGKRKQDLTVRVRTRRLQYKEGTCSTRTVRTGTSTHSFENFVVGVYCFTRTVVIALTVNIECVPVRKKERKETRSLLKTCAGQKRFLRTRTSSQINDY